MAEDEATRTSRCRSGAATGVIGVTTEAPASPAITGVSSFDFRRAAALLAPNPITRSVSRPTNPRFADVSLAGFFYAIPELQFLNGLLACVELKPLRFPAIFPGRQPELEIILRQIPHPPLCDLVDDRIRSRPLDMAPG